MRIVVGNRKAISSGTDVPGKHATEVEIDDSWTPVQVIHAFTDGDGIWANHSRADAPAWVASDDQGMAELLSTLWGGIEVRSLEGPETGKKTANGKVLRAATTALMLMLPTRLLMTGLLLSELMPYLKTNAGHDFQARQMASGTASATAVAKWMALTANATAPAAADTTLTGEIATAGGGLIRQVGAYAHTTGTNTYTITGTFTANGTDTLPVTVAKMGNFDAATAGNMPFTTLITPTATLSASGDVLTVTQTVTM